MEIKSIITNNKGQVFDVIYKDIEIMIMGDNGVGPHL